MPNKSEEYLEDSELSRRTARLRRLAQLLDSEFRIPGTNFRMGLDPIIGLIPGIGDSATFVLSVYLALEAFRLGARKRTLAVMVWNGLLDSLIGSVPLVGDVFDIFFKSHQRNVHVLLRDLERQQENADL